MFENNAAPSNKKGFKGGGLKDRRLLSVLVVLLILAGVAGTAFYYNKYNDVKNDPNKELQNRNQQETSQVLDNLKKVLRTDDSVQPTVARVEDPEKLKASNAEFYKDVEKGDYLVIYPTRAIIYRNTANQVVNVAPIINTSKLQEQQQQAEEQKQPATNNTNNTNTRTNR